jgi:hypothetical protein
MASIGYLAAIALGTLVSASLGNAAAQEYCVACTEPYGLYRCVIEGAQPHGGQPLQMLCITTIAKDGGHATCGVKRATVFECDGPVRRIPWVSIGGQAEHEASQPAAVSVPRFEGSVAPGPSPTTQPQTMVDLAKQVNEKTAAQVNKTGESVKQVTTKSWDCLLSLFTRC